MRPLAGILLAFTLTAQDLPKFQGRQVTVTKPELDPDGFFPKGPATVCLEGPPQRRCYTAIDKYGNNPAVSVVKLNGSESALFFSAESGGISGFSIYFALLEPGTGKDLQNILFISPVSNQSQHAFWTEPSISEAPVFVTADYSLGPNEGALRPTPVYRFSLCQGTVFDAPDRFLFPHRSLHDRADI